MKYIITLALVIHVFQVLFINPAISQSAGMFVLALGWVMYWSVIVARDLTNRS